MVKVLIGEDEEYSAEIYRISLRAKGHDVIITNDGEKCVKVFKHEFEQLHHVLLSSAMRDNIHRSLCHLQQRGHACPMFNKA